MKALDSSAKTTGQAKNLAEAGYGALGVYLRSDRCTKAMIDELHGTGLKVWTVYERGYPTSDDYFTAAKGVSDGTVAARFAKSVGQPPKSLIYAAVDYNAKTGTIQTEISGYMESFGAAIAQEGYLPGVYGSGLTCRILIQMGLAKAGWLAQSTSFSEYKVYKPKAAIVQLARINNNWDGDEISDPAIAGLW
jgi:hypothetical protein